MNKWWILTASAMMVLLTSIDGSAVFLILAPLSVQLHVPLATLHWVLNSYLLIFTACIIAGGRLGDIFGQRRILIIGVLLFVIASLMAVVAQNVLTIFFARLIQGVGAALISPNAMAIIYIAFPEEQKGIASGIMTSVIGGGISIGPFVGGLLATLYSWRLVFFINIPIGIIALILIGLFVKYQIAGRESIKRLDLPGVILLGLALFSLIAAIDVVDNLPAKLIWFISLLAATSIFSLLFYYVEKRASNPLIKVKLLKNRIITYGCLIRLLFNLPIMVLFFIITLYLQRALGYTPLQTGIMTLPLPLMMVFLAPYAGKMVDKMGHNIPFVIGMSCFLIAFLGFAEVGKHPSVFLFIIFAALAGVGLGFGRPALVTTVMKAVPKSELGLVSSTFNMMNNLGGVIGIAVTGVILGFFASYSPKQALLYALPITMWMCVGVIFLVIILIFVGLRK